MRHSRSSNTVAAVTRVAALLLFLVALALAMIVPRSHVQAMSSTNASIAYVVIEQAYDVDVGIDSVHQVQVGVKNKGDITAGIDLVLLLRSTMGQCEARWNPEPGDAYIEDPIGGMIFSEIDRTLPDMLPGEMREITRTYRVRCFQKSFHDNAILFNAGVVPTFPVAETDPSDNSQTQQIDITAFDVADVQKLGLFAFDVTIDASDNTVVSIRSVFRNNGPYGATNPGEELVTVSDDITVTPSGSCPVSPDQILGTPVELPVSVDVVLDQVFTLSCNAPGQHTIEWDDCIAIQNVHVRDPNPGNNCISLAMVFSGVQMPGPPVVGGTLGLVESADAPRQTSGSPSTPNSTLPLAAAAAGGVVALAAGGWYAGRRWIR